MVTMVSVSHHGHDGVCFSPWSRWYPFLTLVTMIIIRSVNTATADEEMTNVFGESDLLIWNKVVTAQSYK